MVQWSSLNRSLDVYVNVATGNIVGIEEQTDVGPTPTPTWTLTTFIVEGNESSPIPETTITARFENGTVSGTAGCNQYFGPYTVVNEITIGENLGMTMMYCSEPGVMQQEAQYTDILVNVTTYTIEENQLTLSTEDGRALVYQAESDTTTPTPTALPTLTPTDYSQEGTIWTLTSFIVEGNESSPIPGTTITASFENGTISGNAGCNQYFGPYTVVNEISIGGEDKLLGMTMMLCSEPIMDQEAQYTDILVNVTAYTIEENQLTLSTEDNRTLVYQV
jgi:heat shock protein HslJ